ncbi:MAG: alkaline phosphatase family protein [Pontimonas sp.]
MVLPGTEATVRLADVLTSCWSALRAEDNPLSLAPVSKAAVLVVDGMGAHNLRARKGHARWLSENWSRRGIVGDSGFPSTTASALASLTTGCGPGEHGIVGYTVRDPRSGALINHLKEWEPHVDPNTWQRCTTLFEKAGSEGIPSLSMGERRFAGTGFTRAVWRGATFVGTESLDEQFVRLRDFFDENDQALAYLYWPALDRTGHSSGVESEAWIRRLEDLDQQLRSLESVLRPDEGLVITADHGMVDVRDEGKLLVPEGSPLVDSVAAWGGEPRVAQLDLEDGADPDSVATRWREEVGEDAIVLTRKAALDQGLWGDISDEVARRVGDVIVMAVAERAFYRSEVASVQSMRMVGQHGSITREEREIPVIPLGAWA